MSLGYDRGVPTGLSDRSLLLVVAEFPPLGGGGVIRATKLVKYLDRLGWRITVVSMDEAAPAAVDPSLQYDVPTGVRVVRVRGPMSFIGATAARTRRARQGSLSLIRGGLRRAVASAATPDRWAGWAIAASRMSRADAGAPAVILSSGPPHSGHVAGVRLSHRFGVPLALDFRDEWRGNPLYRSVLPWRRLADWYLERQAINRAAAVVFVSDESRRRYAKRYRTRAHLFHTIPNGFDPEDFPPSAFEGEQSTQRQLHYVYAGSIHGSRDARAFFRAFGRFARTAPISVHLDLVGPVRDEQASFARETIEPPSLTIHGFVPHTEAIVWMRGADILVGISNSSEAGSAAQTGKVFEYLAARRPIVMLAPESPATRLVAQAGAGVTCNPDDETAIEAALLDAANLAASGTFTGASAEFRARYDRAVQAEEWSALLLRVAAGDGANRTE
jgi:glycosyltransferase involved in cell wall biosynthesis